MIGYLMDAVTCGYQFGRDSIVIKSVDNAPVWVYSYRIGCYIRDAWRRLR